MRARVSGAVVSMVWMAVPLMAAGLTIATGCSPNARATAPSTLRLIVPTNPGGAYDAGARLVAAHLGRFLPGEPVIGVENMPGAGGIAAANYIARQQGNNALLAYLGENAVIAQLLREPQVQYDLRSLGIVGTPDATDGDVCVALRSSGLSLDAWRQSGVTRRIGITAKASAGDIRTRLIAGALGLQYKPVVGYQGTAQIRMALASGEVDALCTAESSWVASFSPQSDYTLLVREGDTHTPTLAQVPTASSLVSSPDARQMLAAWTAVREVTRTVFTPPDTSPDWLVQLQQAFAAMVEDPVFQRAAAAAGVRVAPAPPDAMRRRIASLLSDSSAAATLIRAAVDDSTHP